MVRAWEDEDIRWQRAKGSVDSTHPLSGDELRALRRTQEPGCRFIFMNECGAPMTAAGFRKMLSTVGTACGLPHIHPHMLRTLGERECLLGWANAALAYFWAF